MRIRIIKEVRVPDPIKSERCLRVPELGPNILFFSGGTALRELSQEIIHYTHNTTHIITPFDSGGSSAVIRKAFGMPAVGDLRNRLMALADKSVHGNPAIFELFAHRLPSDREEPWLHEELNRLVKGRHELISAIPNPMRKIIRHYLLVFQNRMPDTWRTTDTSTRCCTSSPNWWKCAERSGRWSTKTCICGPHWPTGLRSLVSTA